MEAMNIPAGVAEEQIAVGCILAIKTTLGDEFEGQVLTFDRVSNILVLQDSVTGGGVLKSGNGRRNIRMLKANFIKEVTFLGQADEDPLDVNKCFLDLNTLHSKEQSAIRQAEIDSERIGVGVTPEAQSIFDALSKTCLWSPTVACPIKFKTGWTLEAAHDLSPFLLGAALTSMLLITYRRLPVRWDKTVIVVMNEVRVSSPYTSERVTGGTPAANERVRKVLELERKRLQNRGPAQ